MNSEPPTTVHPRRAKVSYLGALVTSLALIVTLGPAPTVNAAPTTASAPVAKATAVAAKAKAVRNRCKRNEKFVPSCGILWGSYLSPSGGSHPYKSLEKQVGRRFDMIKAYWGWQPGKVFPNDQQRALGKGGRTWQLSWNAIDYGTRNSARYVDITSGAYDASIIRPQAQALKQWGKRVIIDFDHEMEGSWSQGGVSTNPSNRATDAAEYRAAFRHIVTVFREVGATNVKFAWVPAGWDKNKFAPYYPGRKYVDWVGWDPYNFHTCHGSPYKTPAQTFDYFYSWALSTPGVRKKPLMMGEYGTHNTAQAGAWYRGVGKALKSKPRVKAVIQWGSAVEGCNFRLTENAGALAGFKKSGMRKYVLGAANKP